jgi:hypothetical protein
LLRLINKFDRIVSSYNIESDYNPIKPSAKKIEEFGPKNTKILRTIVFFYKIEYIKTFRKTIVFYSNYSDIIKGNKKKIVILDNNKKDINILDKKKEQEEEIIIKENINKY